MLLCQARFSLLDLRLSGRGPLLFCCRRGGLVKYLGLERFDVARRSSYLALFILDLVTSSLCTAVFGFNLLVDVLL